MIYNFDTLTFRILAIYRYLHPDGHFSVKARPFSSFSFRIGGTADFLIDGKSLSARPGDVVFIPSGVSFEAEYSGSDYLVIELEECNYREAEVISLRNAGELSLLFLSLLERWQASRSVNGAKSAVYAILEKIEEDQKASMEHTAFARCLGYIEEHFCEPELDVAAVCRAGFISVSSLQRAFLRQMGVSPMQYIIGLRIRKAVRLLVENRLRVREIAYACGFSDEKYFSRAFRRVYGYPPSKLRGRIVL